MPVVSIVGLPDMRIIVLFLSHQRDCPLFYSILQAYPRMYRRFSRNSHHSRMELQFYLLSTRLARELFLIHLLLPLLQILPLPPQILPRLLQLLPYSQLRYQMDFHLFLDRISWEPYQGQLSKLSTLSFRKSLLQ